MIVTVEKHVKLASETESMYMKTSVQHFFVIYSRQERATKERGGVVKGREGGRR